MEQDYLAQTALDQMVGTDTNQLIKAAIPYLPPRGQQFFSVYAKASELIGALTLFGRPDSRMEMCAAGAPSSDPLDIINDVRRYCYGDSRKTLDKMANMLAMVEILKEMSDSPENP